MTMMRKASFWIGIFFTLVLAVSGALASDMPAQVRPYLEPIPLLLLGILGWTIITLIDVWSINLDYQESIKALARRADEISVKAEDSARASQDSFKLLNSVTLRLKDYSGLTPIKVGVSNFDDFFIYLPFYVALKFRLFEQEDLSVTPKSLGNDDKAFEALLNAEFQFAITDPGMVTRDLLQGRIIAPLVTKAALWGLSKDAITDISSVTSIVTYPSPSTAYSLVKHWLQHIGNTGCSIAEKSIDSFVTDSDSIVANNQIVCVTEPERSWFCKKYPKLANNQIDFHEALYKEEQFNFTAVLTTQREIEYNNEVVKRFLKALRLAYNLIYSAQPNTTTYNDIVDAAKDYSISSYPSKLQADLDINMSREIFESLRSNVYFSKTVVYNAQQKRGLIHALNLRKMSFPTLDVNEVIDAVLVDAHDRFGLTV
jgi:hypothetical protein